VILNHSRQTAFLNSYKQWLSLMEILKKIITFIRFWNFSDGVVFFLVSHFISLCRYSIHRIMPALKVETDIIASIAASLIGQAVILVTMYCMSNLQN